jgi:hypothetical protein
MAALGHGKRGGARVIYYFQSAADRIYLICGYIKSKQEDLSPNQIRTLRELLGDLEHG